MTATLQPENHNKRYEALFQDIDSGQIKLPMFQRDFVWDKEQSAKLLDSILKGFPIGTFIFWKTREELRSFKNVGNHRLPDTPRGDYVQYILDGQQRITSLYAIRKGIRLTKDGREIDYQDIFIDLDCDVEGDEQIVVAEKISGRRYVSVHRLLASELIDFEDEFPAREIRRQLSNYRIKLTTYDFAAITIKDYPIEIACEIFTRINTGGKKLEVFEIMVARTYDEVEGFDLSIKYDELRDGTDDEKDCLRIAKFETISPTIVMQCVAAIAIASVKSKDVLKIRREDFIKNWSPMRSSLFMAIDFVRSELRVPASHLLPYPSVLIPFVFFFHKTGNKKATFQQTQRLEQFFYWVGLTQRYSSATETKLLEDFKKMADIFNDRTPTYSALELWVTPQKVEETSFSPSTAFCKTLLCLLAYQQPKSFDTNGSVILDNSHLKIATSRNYHHFFPKAYLQKTRESRSPDLIANITLIDGYSNKHRIGAKPPSEYIQKLSKDNIDIAATLKTHLIDDVSLFGIDADNYEIFVRYRSKAIADKLNRKLSAGVPVQDPSERMLDELEGAS